MQLRNSLIRNLTLVSVFILSLSANVMAQSSSAEQKNAGTEVVYSEEMVISDLDQAGDQIKEGNAQEGSSKLREIARTIENEASSAGAKSKSALQAAARELTSLAKEVESGAKVSEERVKSTFSRVGQRLAMHHQNRAKESWARKETKQTAHDLKVAANYLERSAKWSGRKLEKGAQVAINDARKISGKLDEGAAYSVNEVAKAVQGLGSAISTASRKLAGEK